MGAKLSDNRAGNQEGFYLRFQSFRHLFWRARIFMLVSFPLALIGTGGIAYLLAQRPPQLSATALIGTENTEDMAAVKDVNGLMQAHSDMIQSRTFLKEIVSRLSLQLAVVHFPRASIFDTVLVDSAAAPGKFDFVLEKKPAPAFSLYFTPLNPDNSTLLKKLFPEKKLILQGGTADLARINGGGMHLVFSHSFLDTPHDFSFRILEMRNAVETTYDMVSVKEITTPAGNANISVSLSGRDYQLMASIANTIADVFVEKNASYKKSRSKSVLSSLEKQLDVVSKDLAAAEDAVKNFRSANPMVGLTDRIQQRVVTLSKMETDIEDQKEPLAEIAGLESRFSGALSADDKTGLAGEALVFLINHNNSSAPVLQAALNGLLAQKHDYEQNYALDHPLRITNQNKIDALEKTIMSTLHNYRVSAQNTVTNKNTDVQALAGELQRLPTKELQLAELQRRQQITSDLYSSVLNRFNQAKAANAGNMAEVFVMDYAVGPMPPPPNVPKSLALALMAAIMITMLPVFVYNYFDRTAHSEYEFTLKTGKLLLEEIPKSDKLIHKNDQKSLSPGNGTIIAHLDHQGSIREIFRALRTKVLMKLYNFPQKSLMITSLEPGCGKSTIAVNLAYSMAQQGLKTVLVDGDLRCGTLHRWLDKNQTPGLSEFLREKKNFSEEEVTSLVQPTALANLSFISSGELQKKSTELLSANRLRLLTNELTRRFSMVIFDTPPLGPVIDAAVMAPLFSGCLVIARAGATNLDDLTKKIAEFSSFNDTAVGYILNFAAWDKKTRSRKYAKYYG
ncbi:MAG: polysaccharide biosynthesis tyrosine autokinase [Chitinivibrionales bacterium]|nr:polysaccharide biosynthesis tyrosine autokinase [Chitinivibrionales bacterium]